MQAKVTDHVLILEKMINLLEISHLPTICWQILIYTLTFLN